MYVRERRLYVRERRMYVCERKCICVRGECICVKGEYMCMQEWKYMYVKGECMCVKGEYICVYERKYMYVRGECVCVSRLEWIMSCTTPQTNPTVCTCTSSGLCWWKSKLWTNIFSWKQEIRWVFSGILKGCTYRQWESCQGQRAVHDSRLRERDLKSSRLCFSHQDADLGSSFQQQLEASTLAPELKDTIKRAVLIF